MYEYLENLIYMLELDNLIDCDDEENNFGRDYDDDYYNDYDEYDINDEYDVDDEYYDDINDEIYESDYE